MPKLAKIVPHLWYSTQAVEAANFYVSLLPDSRVDSVTTLPSESPSGPPGTVDIVDFTLAGQQFQAISAGTLDPFNHSISFVINCDTQAEIDKLWDALGKGGKIEQCGWLKDRFGVSWQIVPSVLTEMMRNPDRARVKRVTDVMLKMVKLDIAELTRAYEGR